jgi:hypothetical protein
MNTVADSGCQPARARGRRIAPARPVRHSLRGSKHRVRGVTRGTGCGVLSMVSCGHGGESRARPQAVERFCLGNTTRIQAGYKDPGWIRGDDELRSARHGGDTWPGQAAAHARIGLLNHFRGVPHDHCPAVVPPICGDPDLPALERVPAGNGRPSLPRLLRAGTSSRPNCSVTPANPIGRSARRSRSMPRLPPWHRCCTRTVCTCSAIPMVARSPCRSRCAGPNG